MAYETTISYRWTIKMPQRYKEWVFFGEQTSKIVAHYCNIGLFLRKLDVSLDDESSGSSSSESEDDGDRVNGAFEVLIRKSNMRSTKVIIVLKVVDNDPQSISLDDWKTDHTFTLPNYPNCSPFDVSCDITWFHDQFLEPIPFKWKDEIKLLYLNPTFSDVKIIIDNEELPAHKLVLSACSSVFYAMLTAPRKENEQNQIVIKDVQIEVMKTVLKFLYEGCSASLEVVDRALKVLAVAEKYDIRNLKEICEYKLYRKLTVENVSEILREADTHGACKLRKKCWNFITEHKEQVIEVESFELLCHEKPALMYDFLKRVIRNQLVPRANC